MRDQPRPGLFYVSGAPGWGFIVAVRGVSGSIATVFRCPDSVDAAVVCDALNKTLNDHAPKAYPNYQRQTPAQDEADKRFGQPHYGHDSQPTSYGGTTSD